MSVWIYNKDTDGHSETCQVWINISVYRSVQCRPLSKYQICVLCRRCDEGKDLIFTTTSQSVKSAMKTAWKDSIDSLGNWLVGQFSFYILQQKERQNQYQGSLVNISVPCTCWRGSISYTSCLQATYIVLSEKKRLCFHFVRTLLIQQWATFPKKSIEPFKGTVQYFGK